MSDHATLPFAEPELWVPVPGYEGLYEASPCYPGKVKSLPRPGTSGGILSWYIPEDEEHPRVTLTREGKGKPFRVHQVIASTFLGPLPEGMETRHLDGNPQNNALSNLIYGTRSENTLDAVQHKTHPQARKTHCPAGHPYDEENTRFTPGAGRQCIACQRERADYRGGVAMGLRTHCPKGHPYSEENTYVTPTGGRQCRTCNHARESARSKTRKRGKGSK